MRTVAFLLGLLALSLPRPGVAEEKKAPEPRNVPPPGFTALFNGKDLTNWQGLVPLPDRKKYTPEQLKERQKKADELMRRNWKVIEGGVLYYDGKGASLQTAKDYGEFELLIDWKIEEKGDSGIYLRGQPQVQIWDSDRTPGARGLDKGSGSGALWNNPEGMGKRPLVKADNPVGEWNTFRITVKDDKVTVFLNGKLVLDKAPLLNFWDRKSPVPATGPIELQHHGDRLWFRNIYIRELDKK